MSKITLTSDWKSKARELEAKLDAESDAELLNGVSRCLALSAELFFECALRVKKCNLRGLDVRPAVNGWYDVLLRIAEGILLPELVAWCGKESVLRIVKRLLLSDQQKLIERGTLEFVEGDSVRLVDPRQATGPQLKQLFSEDGIREPHEQRRWLAEQQRPRKTKVKPSVSAVKDVDESELTGTLSVEFTAEEMTAIRLSAKQNKWALKRAARRFLLALGKK